MRFKVLRAQEQQPDLSQRQLADMLGVSLGKANYLLHALLDKGLPKARNFRNSQNKLAYAYLLTPSGIAQKAELTRGYLERKTAEYEALKDEIEQLQADLTANHDPPRHRRRRLHRQQLRAGLVCNAADARRSGGTIILIGS